MKQQTSGSMNYWGGSFDYRYSKIHVNKDTASYRPDGSIRIIVTHRDPELPGTNWLDTAGHDRGVWLLRFLEPSEDRLPTVREMSFSELQKLDDADAVD